MKTIVLATKNAGKKRELEALLAGLPVMVKTLADYPEIGDIEESGTTFRENAELKARQTCAHTGLVSIGDDSGLEVDALNGAPGIYSARFSGADHDDAANNAHLLKHMSDIPEGRRQARFRSVMAVATPEGELYVGEGILPGWIDTEPRGQEGFGYDPLFVPENDTRSLAMLSMQEKNKISHRSRALQDIFPVLIKLIGVHANE